ncbi:MAG TPA: shikimate dehydrogenase [Bryobacteraceae bacterium]|nr:shikimate dehydrogenase [Bryobacteraceae bacterium]HPT26249.1 shikimate dehydrogenase [Bryobacteraceae bacterium]
MLLRKHLPKICIALGQSDPVRLLELARHEASCGERFLEFRLDYLSAPAQGAALIGDFLKQYPECSILATCRRHQNHGRFNGSIEQQLAVLEQAIANGARAVDVEIESAELALSGVRELASHATLVVSYHNYEGTPAMEPVLRRILKVPADAYKIVTTARKPSDNLRLLALAKSAPKSPLILLAMSETGFPSRVLSLAGGGLYTYAAPTLSEGTAAGQVCARSLRQLYRSERLSKNTRVYGVIADPVRHSISPAVHNRALQSRRIDAVYLPFLVTPLQLKDFFVLAEKLPVNGFSVTIPHKQRVIRYLDVVDPLAKRIGAVNTVWRKAGKWRGANTDAAGVRTPLERRLKLGKATVLVVGNGGAARSAVFALTDAGAQVFITGRNPDRVRALAKACGATPVPAEHAADLHFDVLVHATPLGMWPDTERCYFNDQIPADVVFDLVYNPHDTLLLRRAREQGLEVIHGIEMFVEQASEQFHLFTGVAAPRQLMERAAVEALANHASNHRGECE